MSLRSTKNLYSIDIAYSSQQIVSSIQLPSTLNI